MELKTTVNLSKTSQQDVDQMIEKGGVFSYDLDKSEACLKVGGYYF